MAKINIAIKKPIACFCSERLSLKEAHDNVIRYYACNGTEESETR